MIAGDADAIAEATAIAKELGARKVLPLPVGGAFHTPFMAPAAERLRTALAATAFADAEVPVIANVDALPHQHADQWAEPARRPAHRPGALAPDGRAHGRRRRHRLRRARPRRRAHRHGQALRARRHRQGRRRARRPRHDRRGWPPAPTPVDHHDGEHLFASERLVVSPAAGVFVPAADVAEGQHIERGRVVGTRRRPRGPLAVPRHREGAPGRRPASASPAASRSPGCALHDIACHAPIAPLDPA